MTLDDWWAEIERYTREGDRNGLLVCADGVEELGEGELAATIRWVVAKSAVPMLLSAEDISDPKNPWFMSIPDHRRGRFWERGETCRSIWLTAQQFRTDALEWYR